MILRKLQLQDAPFMYEWMTSKDVNKYFRFDPKKVSLDSCREFIKNSFSDTEKNYAIDENGEYIGTVSLKHIDYHDLNAEYAISLREKYRKMGYGFNATKEILKIAFEELKLNKVYLNVLSSNENATRMYEKIGFVYEGELKNHIKIGDTFRNLKLYGIWRDDYEKMYKDN